MFSWPDKQRMPNLLLIVPTNNGKSMIAGRGDARREFLSLLRFLGNELRIPLVGGALSGRQLRADGAP
ncbi:TniB family NTP-binding protein [Micromonospora zamorensis]|uniref:TniB family NTP-binding protein n=1 Tax=Micromonospora zamorensis TaxID=709883 RepID=UPI003D935804